ncbi:hypothetical protein PIB30_021394 [Stylosanthes scabra]|uniref:Uncharacterized protein n=1 Tax=Stylosanthes scabra TaxID=79078 RepID=A0ABU6S946_9FABA|nr:hypothetical protein [Stylosanthes scabra]
MRSHEVAVWSHGQQKVSFYVFSKYTCGRTIKPCGCTSQTGTSVMLPGTCADARSMCAAAQELQKTEMKRLEHERAVRIVAGEPAGPPINEDAVWDMIADGQKRGRVYGKGKVPTRPAPRQVDPDVCHIDELEDPTACEGVQAGDGSLEEAVQD